MSRLSDSAPLSPHSVPKVHLHFVTTQCSHATFEDLWKQFGVPLSMSFQKFFSLLAEGIAQAPDTSVHVTSVLPVNSEFRRVYFPPKIHLENGVSYASSPVVNIPIVRNVWAWLYVFFTVLLSRDGHGRRTVYVIDYLRLSINTAVVAAAWLRRKGVVAVVTDLPQYSPVRLTLVDSIRSKLLARLKYDYYVAVTSALDAYVNREGRPSMVLESISDPAMGRIPNAVEGKYEERVVVYAGNLDPRYGILGLIQAFSQLPEARLRLWIYGSGPALDAVKSECGQDSRIVFKGVVPNEELVPVLCRATLLVNPRPTGPEYTKYSYPGKNMEYMSSGTPLVTTRLPGIPDDHIPFVYFFDDEGADGIRSSLASLLSRSPEELHSFGMAAREYVLREKDKFVQGRRVTQFLLER
jgi:glycosyltransferase involved in cell wall biosynthesis